MNFKDETDQHSIAAELSAVTATAHSSQLTADKGYNFTVD
jgi:hypothetical protein